jgi:hypothetical protein
LKRLLPKLLRDGAEVVVIERFQQTLDGLVGLPCWYASAGGSAGSTFSLAFGQPVLRARVLRNPDVSELFRINEGEMNLIVWCSWRLDSQHAALASSDSDASAIASALEKLCGQHVQAATIASKAFDLVLRFDTHELYIFCDHVEPDPSFDGNWDLHTRTDCFSVGPGWRLCVERREVSP